MSSPRDDDNIVAETARASSTVASWMPSGKSVLGVPAIVNEAAEAPTQSPFGGKDRKRRPRPAQRQRAGRLFVSRDTLWRLERGDPTVALGTLATAAFVLIEWQGQTHLVGRLYASERGPAVSFINPVATIRWAGRENTHLIRPNGQAEILGSLLNRVSRPDKVDESAFLMNIAINAVAREGYEVTGFTDDLVIMRRALARRE